MNRIRNEFLLCFFLGFLGAHRFYRKQTGLGFLYLFTFGLFGIGWLVDTIRLLIKLTSKNQTTNNLTNKTLPFTQFNVAGLTYYQNEVKEVVKAIRQEFEPGTLWQGKTDEQIKKSNSSKQYYEFPIMARSNNITLVKEPDNQHDSNAIRIMINGFKIGYVPTDMTEEVWNIYQAANSIQWTLFGGRYKELDDGEAIVREMPYRIEVHLKRNQP